MSKTKRKKPSKPHPDFPLTANGNGQWSKKIKGRVHYFGAWEDPQAAITKWLAEKDYLLAGKLPPRVSDGYRVQEMCNRFLTAKKKLVESEELTQRTWQDYNRTCKLMISHFGGDRLIEDLRVADFDEYRDFLSRGRGVYALGNQIRNSKVVFNYAYDSELIDRPFRYGQTFRVPSQKSLRISRAKKQAAHGLRMLEADEIRLMLNGDEQKQILAARQPMRAMILLAINGGLGATDLARLPKSLAEGEWLNYPRPKTGVNRRIPLWPETREALDEAIDRRPTAKNEDDDALCFITKQGNPFVRLGPSGKSNIDHLTSEFSKLLVASGLKRKGLGFYALRHGFETIAGESRDQPAVDAIMGHEDGSMSSRYRERISDERLESVVNHVRSWLFQ